MNQNQQNGRKSKELIVFTVLLLAAVFHYQVILGWLKSLLGMISPFLIGAGIAFILNVPMRFFESLLPNKEKFQKGKRPLSLCAAMCFVAAILTRVIFVVVPEVVSTFSAISMRIPAFFAQIQAWAEEIFAVYPNLSEEIAALEFDWNKIFDSAFSFLKLGAGTMLNSTVTAARSIISAFTTFGIAFIFAIYILIQKETLGRQLKKLIQAYLPKKKDRILQIAALTEETFSHFLTGQCVEAVILGTMFFVVLSLFRLPYALLIGVLIAFTALIPVFGAFLGCAVGIFLMLMVNPMDALWFTIIFLVLQQLEGNLIYPHVVGGSVNLPSIWVLVAVTLGGSLLGVLGMLVFIPLCSVCYALLKEHVNLRIQKQK
ncbi:MAG: AI-2E family transporter [bacterium]|nr:AI-2E family transporter [bacterium]